MLGFDAIGVLAISELPPEIVGLIADPFDTHDGSSRDAKWETPQERLRRRQRELYEIIARRLRGEVPNTASPLPALPDVLTRLLNVPEQGIPPPAPVPLAVLAAQLRQIETDLMRLEDDEIAIVLGMMI